MVSRCSICCAVLALLMSLLVPLLRWAVPMLLYWSFRPRGDQEVYQPRILPNLNGNLVRNLPTNAFVTDHRMDFLELNFTHQPGDIWVATYQKVGTTWTQYMLTQILGLPKVHSVFEVLQHCPMPECATSFLSHSEEALQHFHKHAAHRCFKSHWPRKDFIANLPKGSKVIYVMRNAESVAISYYQHIITLYFYYMVLAEDIPWEAFFEKFVTGDVDNGDYFEHVASWWKARDDPNLLLLRYEDMKKDPASIVQKISYFVGVNLDDARIAEVVETTSFQAMKAWRDSLPDTILYYLGALRGTFVRKGAGKEEGVSLAQRERLVQRYNTVLKPLGMPFEYMFATP